MADSLYERQAVLRQVLAELDAKLRQARIHMKAITVSLRETGFDEYEMASLSGMAVAEIRAIEEYQ